MHISALWGSAQLVSSRLQQAGLESRCLLTQTTAATASSVMACATTSWRVVRQVSICTLVLISKYFCAIVRKHAWYFCTRKQVLMARCAAVASGALAAPELLPPQLLPSLSVSADFQTSHGSGEAAHVCGGASYVSAHATRDVSSSASCAASDGSSCAASDAEAKEECARQCCSGPASQEQASGNCGSVPCLATCRARALMEERLKPRLPRHVAVSSPAHVTNTYAGTSCYY